MAADSGIGANWGEMMLSIVQVVAVLVAGIWSLYCFKLYRRRFPSIEIENGIQYIGENDTEYLLELYCVVSNKGRTRKWLLPFGFQLLYLSKDDTFKGKTINEEVEFNYFRFEKAHFYQRKWWVDPQQSIPFVDRKSKKRFQFLVAVPKECTYFLLKTYFIDFSNKRKGAAACIALQEEGERLRKLTGDFERKSFKEKVYIKLEKQGELKGDYYHAQITAGIEAIKAAAMTHTSPE